MVLIVMIMVDAARPELRVVFYEVENAVYGLYYEDRLIGAVRSVYLNDVRVLVFLLMRFVADGRVGTVFIGYSVPNGRLIRYVARYAIVDFYSMTADVDLITVMFVRRYYLLAKGVVNAGVWYRFRTLYPAGKVLV